MIQVAGAISILVTCSLYGFLRAAHYAKRPKQIRQLIVSLQRLETEIVYAQTPLTEAFEHLSHHIDQPFADWFRQLTAHMKQEHQMTLGHLWGQAFQVCVRQTSLKSPEIEIVNQIGHVLGTSDYRDQVKHVQLAIRQLQMEETESRHEQQRYESMWRSLGCMLGALIVILMY